MVAHNRVREPVLGDRRISGPMLITHTKNDKAVGIAYPLAFADRPARRLCAR